MTRRRYVYDPETKSMREIDDSWTDTPRRAPVATEALVYGSLGRATDGTPIDSRTKHRSFMKANGLTVHSDFTQTFERAAQEREKAFTPGAGFDAKRRRETLERAAWQLENRKSKR